MPADRRLLLAASACLEIVLYNVPRRVKIIWLVMRAQAPSCSDFPVDYYSSSSLRLLECSSHLSITNLCAYFSKGYPITKHGICSSTGNLVCRRRSYIARIDRSRLFCCRAEIFARKGSLARGGCNELSLPSSSLHRRLR